MLWRARREGQCVRVTSMRSQNVTFLFSEGCMSSSNATRTWIRNDFEISRDTSGDHADAGIPAALTTMTHVATPRLDVGA